jgi:hypothetical protein
VAVSAKSNMVCVRARRDLTKSEMGFQGPRLGPTDVNEASSGLIQLVTSQNVTSITNNVGVVEVVSVGRDVHNVKPGDVVMVDFFDVAQGCLAKNDEHYFVPCHAISCTFDSVSGKVTPLPGYVVTKRAVDRMKVALTGTDRLEVPRHLMTEGIPGGKDANGTPISFVIYEEVVAIGDVVEVDESYSRREAMQRAEIRKLKGLPPLPCDFAVGELVVFCTAFSIQVRVNGEFLRITPQCRVLGAIDDAAILDRAIRDGRAGQLIMVS